MNTSLGVYTVISELTSLAFSYVTIALQIVGSWFTFKKMGKPGWMGIIPFYSTYVLFRDLWETKQFWRMIVYLIILTVAMFIGAMLIVFGAVFLGVGINESSSVMGVGIALLILGILISIGSFVFVVLYIIIEFRLYSRLAAAFRLNKAWAWGLLFLPFVFFPILGFSKSIFYYGPVSQS